MVGGRCWISALVTGGVCLSSALVIGVLCGLCLSVTKGVTTTIVASSVLFVSIITGITMTIVACRVILSVSLRHKGSNNGNCS